MANKAGTENSDFIDGTKDADVITALGGVDVVRGLEGDDEIRGGKGNDRLFGGAGIDFLYGDEDNDSLSGDLDDDVLLGGEGVDNLTGGAGSDILVGGGQKDALTGGPGADYFALYLDDPVLAKDFNKAEGDQYIVLQQGVAIPTPEVGTNFTLDDILPFGTVTDDPTPFLNNQSNTSDTNPLAIDPISANPLIV